MNDFEQDQNYWLQKLAGDLVVTSLPLDHQRSVRPVTSKERFVFTLEAETAARLKQITSNDESLLFVAFIMAFDVCLYKYTGNEDIVIGTTTYYSASMNRLLALRTRVMPDLTVRQLLLDIKDTLAEAYAHQKFSFERLIELLNAEHLPHRMPLFDLMVVLENTDNTDYVKRLKNDLTVSLTVKDEITGAIDYNAELFRLESIEALVRHLHEVLHSTSESPDQTIAQLTLSGSHLCSKMQNAGIVDGATVG